MNGESVRALLAAAIPGEEITGGSRYDELAAAVPQAWKLWRSKDAEWAVFITPGEHLSGVDKQGVTAARANGLHPVFVISSYHAIRTLSPHYRTLRPYLVYEIAGLPCLVPPAEIPGRARRRPRRPRTRIPYRLLRALIREKSLPSNLRTSLQRLARKYKALSHTKGDNDQAEEQALLAFASELLQQMGLRPESIRATAMIRTLERGGLGAHRDHFFHTFQNYFLGLLVVARLRDHFQAYRDRARLDWNIDPFTVWFLTSMWHDVGYTFQMYDSIYDAVFGPAEPDIAPQDEKLRFLSRPTTQEALRTLSSLLARLLNPQGATTQWLPPRPSSNLGTSAMQLHEAMCHNVRRSHGAVGALRLFCDFQSDLDKMDPHVQDVLRQTVFLACCSIPFHDWWFRFHVRQCCGQCRLTTTVLPFAVLLAFVDSIQDDQRDLEGVREAVLVLEDLLIEDPATVVAKINPHALDDESLLDKIIEARDVLASLDQVIGELYFKYPSWMAGQA